MPNETLIAEIENVFAEIVDLGGQNEDSKIVPNLTVVNAAPTNLDGWLIVSDNRDGDNILARKVGSVVYSNNDLVNVIFPKGGEAIAFQQGSESTNSGIWEIVPSTSTDIFYNKGQVGIGTATPGEALDVAGNITLDADIIHRGDTDTKISFTADDIEFTAGGLSMLKLTEAAQDLIALGPGSGDVDIDFNGDAFLRGSDGRLGINTAAPLSILHTTGSTTPLFVKETAQTSTPSNNTNFQHKTSGNMADGFGVFNVFTAMDSSLVQNIIGSIGFIRDGADNEGAFIVKAGTNGLEEFMRITNTGEIGINGITSPSTELDIGAGAIEFNEMTAPAAGAANTARLFTQDNGAGKTQLAVRFNTGAIQILATEP